MTIILWLVIVFSPVIWVAISTLKPSAWWKAKQTVILSVLYTGVSIWVLMIYLYSASDSSFISIAALTVVVESLLFLSLCVIIGRHVDFRQGASAYGTTTAFGYAGTQMITALLTCGLIVAATALLQKIAPAVSIPALLVLLLLVLAYTIISLILGLVVFVAWGFAQVYLLFNAEDRRTLGVLHLWERTFDQRPEKSGTS